MKHIFSPFNYSSTPFGFEILPENNLIEVHGHEGANPLSSWHLPDEEVDVDAADCLDTTKKTRTDRLASYTHAIKLRSSIENSSIIPAYITPILPSTHLLYSDFRP
jgi:hypothetical protein